MRFSLYFIVFFSIFIFPNNGYSGDVVDRIAAVVNDDAITLSEINEEGEPMYQRIRNEVPSDQVDDTLKKAQQKILSGLIDQLLISQRAEQRNIEIDPSEIDAAIDNILTRNNSTIEQFHAELAKMGSNEKIYRKNLKNQILRSRLISYEIRSKIVITDQQILDYYQKSYGSIKIAEGFHLLQFGCGWGENGRSGSSEEANMRAIQLRDMVLNGSNFSELSKEYSDLPSAADGGDIGVFSKEELADYMWEAIKDLKPGETSELILTPSGFQFFKLLSSKKGNVLTQAPFESVSEEIRTKLYEEELGKKFDNWVKQLREHSYVEELL